MKELVATGHVLENVSLAPLVTYKFGGPARYFAEVRDAGQLRNVLEAARDHDLPTLVIGRGSNLVVADVGYEGVVIKLAGTFLDIERDGDAVVAGAAVALPRLARTTAREGRTGLEFFVGIPGSVGGAVVMNAGCFGSETADWLATATVLDTNTMQTSPRTPQDLNLSYRHSNVAATEVVLDARFRTEPGSRDAAESKMREITRWRRETQPGGTFNAGSVFKNPEGDAAGRIIDSIGLRGFRLGGAAVSERHANFFVAEAGARAQDIFDLVHTVASKVETETGVTLEPEIRFVGAFDPPGLAT